MAENDKEHEVHLKKGQVQIPLKWGAAQDLPSIYANQLLISHAGGEFYLIFGEVSIPFRVGVSQETIPESLEVKPVAKLVVRPDVMLQIAEAINTNVGRYLSRQVEHEDEK